MWGHGVQLDVMDRGPGIAEADRVRLLQPFQRSESSRSRATGGTGLGLAMAANVARRHAGELQLLHREGGGLIARLLLGKLLISAVVYRWRLSGYMIDA